MTLFCIFLITLLSSSDTMTSWRLPVGPSLWAALHSLSWLLLCFSWHFSSCSAMEMCGSNSGWSSWGPCCPGTSASSSSSSCHLTSARYRIWHERSFFWHLRLCFVELNPIVCSRPSTSSVLMTMQSIPLLQLHQGALISLTIQMSGK